MPKIKIALKDPEWVPNLTYPADMDRHHQELEHLVETVNRLTAHVLRLNQVVQQLQTNR